MRPAAALAALAVLVAGCGGGHGSGNTIEVPAGDRAPVRVPGRTDVAAMAARADVPVLCWHQIRAIRGSDGARVADKLDGEHPLYTLRRIIVSQESGAALLRQVRGDF